MDTKKKRTLWKSTVMLLLEWLHFFAIYGSFITCWYFFYASIMEDGIQMSTYDVLLSIVIFAAYFFFANVYGIYKIAYSRRTDLIFSQFLTLLCTYGLAYFIHTIRRAQFYNPLWLLAFFGGSLVFSILWTYLAYFLYFKMHKPKKTILLYTKETDLVRIKEAYKHNKRFDVVEKVNVGDMHFEEIVKIIDGYENVFVAGVQASTRNGIAKYCVDKGIKGFFAPHVGDIILMGGLNIQQFSTPVFSVRRAAPNPAYLFLKRFFDIALSLIGIIVLSPFMLITALIIKLYDRGPVFYSHIRLTKDRKPFKILKFRSMRVDAEKDGVPRLSTEHDDRITPVGKFIRKLRLDELPQLFNILKGDMTIVGPRPERPEIAEKYEKEIPAFALRLQVKAGLTGYAQVYGRYNTDPYDKMQMDLMYINRMSPLEDFKLMLFTVKILFSKESTSGIDDNATTARVTEQNQGTKENE